MGSDVWRDPAAIARDHRRLGAFLEMQAASSGGQEISCLALDLLAPTPGERLLEVGCGVGVFLPKLAGAVAPGGCVVGLDHAATFLAAARERARNQATIQLVQGDICQLPFASDSFDAAYAERVLLHLDDPQAVLRELRRVLKPSGRVVLAEPDLAGVRVDHADAEMVSLVIARANATIRHPRIGLELNRRLFAAGFVDRQVRALTTITPGLTPEERAELGRAAATLVVEGQLTQARVDTLVRDLAAASIGGWGSVTSTMFVARAHK